ALRADIINVMKFWLDLGIDGFRADAVPYLFERDGTNCENLPETHAFLKELRRFIDASYPGRLLLCEANQWPEDVRPYFGDGDEFHMGFHFPIMPRLFMALRRGNRSPLTWIMSRTPPIPEACQWGIFLRNHDELTLEMVTEEERQWMWQVYAPEPRMRLNLGIRRRLAPLLDNDRRKIELAHSLLLTLPGSPIIYYGDEIGMGDNIWLPDRNGVLTPMQWTDGPNAGVSTAKPGALYAPLIDDAVYGFHRINVEAQHADPDSLLNWVRAALRIRRQHAAFGRGDLRLLAPDNPTILAYLRAHSTETLLIVNNLSSEPQALSLALSGYQRRQLIDLFGGENLRVPSSDALRLHIAGCGFHWFWLD
ncbi:MAG TPA: alpha-amylase family glycosyl hydrolase, partial [Anaerolineae bacterium]|nr:alpha-amylase family glycosyl hydrolase [Anaerolineae bacterium]